MIVLDSTRLLRVTHAGTLTTKPSWVVAWADSSATALTETPTVFLETLVANTTETLVASPGSGARLVRDIWGRNNDALADVFVVDVYDGSFAYTIFKGTLNSGDQIHIGNDIRIIDSNGNVKTIFSVPSVSQGGTGATTLGTARQPVLCNGTGALTASAAPTLDDANADAIAGTSATGKKALVLQAKASQTASIQEWQQSDGTLGSIVTPLGWHQMTLARKRVTVQVDRTSTTLSGTNMPSWTLAAGRTYGFHMVFHLTLTSAGGIKFDFNGGSATMTSFISSNTVIANTNITVYARDTALSTGSMNFAGASYVTSMLLCEGIMVVNAAGTFIPQFAQNTASGTSSILVGSYGWLEDVA